MRPVRWQLTREGLFLEGYPASPIVTKRLLHFFWDLLDAALEKGGLTEEGTDRLI